MAKKKIIKSSKVIEVPSEKKTEAPKQIKSKKKPTKKKAEAKQEPGRPTDYDPKYVQMLIDYFSEPPYVEKTKIVMNKWNMQVEIPYDDATDFKSLAGFAVKIGVHRETLLNWSKQHPDFFDAYKRAKDFQENYLVVNGNKGLVNPAFGIFTAKNVLNWRDKKEIDVRDNVNDLSDEEIDKKMAELEAKKGGKT